MSPSPGAEVDVDWPQVGVEGSYTTRTIVASGSQGAMSRNMQVPSRTIVSYGGAIAENDRAVPTLVAVGTVHTIGTLAENHPGYTVEIKVGALSGSTSSARTIVASGTNGVVGSVDVSPAVRTLVSNAAGVTVATASLTVPVRTISAYNLLRLSGTLDSDMPRRTVSSTGLTGIRGVLDLDEVFYTIEGLGGTVLKGTLNVDRGFYTINAGTLTYITLGTEQLTSLALQFNVKQGANSEYTNYAFESLCMFNGRPFGANSGGLYELAGTDDAGTDISAEIETGKTDFEVGNVKKPWSLHLGMYGDGTVQAKLKGARGVEITGKDATIQEGSLKIKHSRDTRSSYWGVNIKNVDGADFQLNNIDFVIETLGRREDY